MVELGGRQARPRPRFCRLRTTLRVVSSASRSTRTGFAGAGLVTRRLRGPCRTDTIGEVSVPVHGTTAPGFERVREAFARVLERQRGAGASFTAWHDGHWVTDVWGGYAYGAGTRPWAEDTLVMPYSVTKPFAAVCALMLVDRGVLDLDAPVQRYWPEMEARTTPRQMLAHRSGHVVLDEPMPAEAWQDWDRICSALSRQV